MYPPLALTLTERLTTRPAGLTKFILVVLGSVFVALSARVSINLAPVPITGQTFSVLLIGAVYGANLGAATLIFYLAQGAAGLPVFAGGGSGLAMLIGPTAGYLYGFVAAAYVVGLMAERGLDRKWSSAWVAFAIGNVLIYIFGVTWLSASIGLENALIHGLIPFLIGDAIKIALASVALPSAWTIVQKFS